jgi:hypothetical protein
LVDWRKRGFDAWLCLQVHDELVFDFPKAGDPRRDRKGSNLGRARVLQKLMEESGTNIGVPTPVAVEYHPDSWAKGYSF